jgi:hypothetical protein
LTRIVFEGRILLFDRTLVGIEIDAIGLDVAEPQPPPFGVH